MIIGKGALPMTIQDVMKAVVESQRAWERALSPAVLANIGTLDVRPSQANHCVSIPHASGWVGHALPGAESGRIVFTQLAEGGQNSPGVATPARLPLDCGTLTPTPHEAYAFDPSHDVVAFVSPTNALTGFR